METDQFSEVKAVISDQLKFKSKLSIGEDAYSTLRIANKVEKYWDNYGWATTGAAAAKSAVVATTFFAPSGILGLVGIGTAVTPVGWVIAAAVLSGGAAIGVKRFLSDATGNRVTVIPKFINTPIDVLAVSLFDLIAPLALKIAVVDGRVTDDERKWIKDYFVNEWGYDSLFIDVGCKHIESSLEGFSIIEIAEKLAKFSKTNPDCNYTEMTHDLIEFLKGVMEADGKIDEREELALEKIEAIFNEAGRTFSKENLNELLKVGKESIKNSTEKLSKAAIDIGNSDAVGNAKIIATQHANDTIQAGKKILGKIFTASKKIS